MYFTNSVYGGARSCLALQVRIRVQTFLLSAVISTAMRCYWRILSSEMIWLLSLKNGDNCKSLAGFLCNERYCKYTAQHAGSRRVKTGHSAESLCSPDQAPTRRDFTDGWGAVAAAHTYPSLQHPIAQFLVSSPTHTLLSNGTSKHKSVQEAMWRPIFCLFITEKGNVQYSAIRTWVSS